MPLPTNSQAEWPPAENKRLAEDMRVADAWWSGDPDRLAEVYGGYDDHEARRPSRRRLRDWFWGRPVDARQRRDRVHVPAASDVAATGADLLFGGDDVRLQIPEAHEQTASPEAKATEEHLTSLAETIGLSSTLLEAAELAGALGGVYLRPTWDQTVSDHAMLAVIHADHAVPVWRWGQLVAVTLWSVVAREGHVVWRHLEHHETIDRRPVILHGLYMGTSDRLGVRVPLDRRTETAGIDADETGATSVPEGITTILPCYIPNALPNRRWRHEPVGRPDTQGVESLMSALDETMTSWMRDLRLGQRRIIVPDQYLQRGGRGQGAAFDLDQEVFSPLSIDPGAADSGTIEVVDFALRTEDHDRTARALFERIVATAGYSPQSFGAHGDGGTQTATEVDAREGRSQRTTWKKRRYYGPAVADAGQKLLAIERSVFGRPVDPMRPRIVWPDLDGTTVQDLAPSVEIINRAQAASVATRVRMLHPDWDKPEIDAEVQAILDEQGIGVDDPTGGFP